MMRFEFAPGRSLVRARMHAFLHTATAETTEVSGGFEIESADEPLVGPVAGFAEVAVGDFDFGNPLLATMARQWIKERSRPVLHFELASASGSDDDATIAGDLTIGDHTNSISASARLQRDGGDSRRRGHLGAQPADLPARHPARGPGPGRHRVPAGGGTSTVTAPGPGRFRWRR